MSPICTHHSRVQPWECDENEHMNAQFYAARFQQATAEFAAATGLVRPLNSKQRLTLRFHAEAHTEQHLVVESALIEVSPHGYAIGHRLLDAASERLLATSIDQSPWQRQPGHLPSRPFEPRFDAPGIDPNPINAPKAEPDALADGGFPSGRIAIATKNMGTDGHYPHQIYVALFGQGAAIAWDVIGLTQDVLQSHRWGGMVVNLSMTILQPLQPGILVKQVSRIVTLRSRVMTIRHDQFNVETGEPIARSVSTGMLVNLNTRRIIALPALSPELALST
ncbi:MAG: thioesterase family protein [Cyanobacteria bacterium P01_F01_bin.56]